MSRPAWPTAWILLLITTGAAAPFTRTQPLSIHIVRMSGKAFNALLIGASAITFAGVYRISGTPKVRANAVAAKMEPEIATSDPVYYSGCREVGAAGNAPLHRGEPGYRTDMDGDGDGIACEDY